MCKERNKVMAEYALSENVQPMGVAEYRVLGPLPEPLQTSLPSIEQLEKELADDPTRAG